MRATNVQDTEHLILVDEHDRQVGTASREACHAGYGLMHRAFVVFLFNSSGQLLLQLRGKNKLGGGRWDASAASHVRNGESYEQSVRRCLLNELGIEEELRSQRVLSYTYTERFDGYSENEYCVLFLGFFDGPVRLNPSEADAARHLSKGQVRAELQSRPQDFTRWFRDAFEAYLRSAPSTEPARD